MSSTEFITADRNVAERAVAEDVAPQAGIFLRPGVCALCLILLLAVAVARIVSTYHVFNHTIDEPSHIAGGIEWWEKGIYRLETKHAPLARISVALGPYLAGVRGTGAKSWQETYPILSADGHYWRNLTLGRIGVLPYFVLATVVVFLWAQRLFGTATGLLAAAVFTLLPPILAHSGLATTDVPLTAMFAWALYAFTLWLRAPTLRNAAGLGIAAGLSVSTKFSTLVFLPGCGAAILLLYVLSGERNWRALVRTFGVVLLCAFFVTWAVYRFSHAPLNEVTKIPDRAAAKVFGKSSRATAAVHQITSRIPLPAPELFDGLRMLRKQNRQGHISYLLGRVGMSGWWYFFIVALALKTPLAVLLLVGGGSAVLVSGYWRNRSDWQRMAPLAAAVMLMLITAPSRLQMGVRYILPIYVFISILAAVGLKAVWERPNQRLIARAGALLLCGWLVVSSARSHPDYLAYFNEFGGRDPSRLLVISDLDWGQDLARLATYLRQQHVQHISLAYDGYFVAEALGLPETQVITDNCGAKPSGWVVVSVRHARVFPQCHPWVAQQRLITRVGKTLSVYYVQQ